MHSFFDDFSENQLDRSVWNVRTTGRIINNEAQAYVDSEETIYIAPQSDVSGSSGAVLVIHPRYKAGFSTPEGDQFDFISGRIDTRDTLDFLYGTISARIKMTVGVGLWPAFWAMGYGKWPDTGEIDIMECVGERDWTSAALHGPGYSGEAGLANNLYFPPGQDISDWHVYTLIWQPDVIEFRRDDHLVYRVTRPMVEFFGPWTYDTPKYLLLNCALGGTYPYKTNGVLQPYFGLHADTVKLIKSGGATYMIDWVRVEDFGAGN